MPVIQKDAGAKWMTATDLAKVYALDPIPAGLDPKLVKHILGGEGCLWTEHIPQDKSEFMAFPRLTGIAEVLWSPAEGKNFDEFYARVKAQYPRLDRMGLKYGRPWRSRPLLPRVARS